VEQGKELIEKELRRLGLEVRANMKDERLLEVAQKFSYQSANDLLGSVGYGKVSAAPGCYQARS